MKSICSADHIIGYNESAIAKNERNDCVVRAMASTFGLSYDSAHKFVANEFDREIGKGTFGTAVKLKCRVHDVMGIKYKIIPIADLLYPGSTRHQANGGKPVSITLSIFLERFPKGRFMVIVKGHAFSVINGVVIGNESDGKRLRAKIIFALKVEE
jgi:hypothetical protein